jgi:hypothetical protein
LRYFRRAAACGHELRVDNADRRRPTWSASIAFASSSSLRSAASVLRAGDRPFARPSLPAVDRAEIAGCHERRNASSGAHELGYMGGRGTLVWAIWAGGGPWSVALRHHFAAARNERIGAARRDQALSPSARHRRRDRDPEKAGAFLCGVAFFRAKFDASRSMLFVQL